MNLLASYKESLALLLPSNLKTFMLITLKTFFSGYKLVIQLFWWLLVGGAAAYFGILLFKSNMHAIRFVRLAILIITCGVWLLAIRTSRERKNIFYFLSRVLRYGPIILFFLGIAVIYFMLILQGIELRLFNVAGFNIILFLSYICGVQCFAFFSLFALDRIGFKGLLHAFTRAVYMIGYNLPLVFISGLFFGVLSLVTDLHYILGLSDVTVKGIDFLYQQLLVIPFYICLLTNIYIKKLHKQSELYFPQPQQKK